MGNYVCRNGARGRETGTRYTTPCDNTEFRRDTNPGFRPKAPVEHVGSRPSCMSFRAGGGCYCPEPMPLDTDGILDSEENPQSGGETNRGDK